MSPLKASLLTALASVTLTIGILYFFHHRRSQEAAELRRANNQMRFDAHQRLQASSSTVSPAATTALPEARASAAPARPEAPAPNAPNQALVEDYRHEGTATPVATLQTLAWASDRGDTDTMLTLICFDEVARRKTEAFLASLPPDARSQWTSPETAAASMLVAAGMNRPFPHARILEKAAVEPLSEDRILLRLPSTPKDRGVYQKIGDNWKFVITEAMVDNYIAHRKAAQPPAR